MEFGIMGQASGQNSDRIPLCVVCEEEAVMRDGPPAGMMEGTESGAPLSKGSMFDPFLCVSMTTILQKTTSEKGDTQ